MAGQLAVGWTGEEMRDRYRPCMMNVQVGPIGAGGATSFVFDRGEVYKWEMNIQGSAERILDSVLPHEITHMIFASYLAHRCHAGPTRGARRPWSAPVSRPNIGKCSSNSFVAGGASRSIRCLR